MNDGSLKATSSDHTGITASVHVNATQIQSIDRHTDAGTDSDEAKYSRLPQSGIVLFGRPWLLGAEDMLVPAACSILSDVFLLALATDTLALLPAHSELSPQCSDQQYSELTAMLALHLVLYFFLTLIDIVTIISAWRSNMFERNRLVPSMILGRMLVSVMITIGSIGSAVIFFLNVRSDCTSTASHSFDVSTMALLISSLISVILVACYFGCSYGFGQLCAPRDRDSWRTQLAKWFTQSGDPNHSAGTEDERDVFSAVATIFSEFFSSSLPDSASVHVVPSDVCVALCLVAADQRHRKRAGERFYAAAGSRRWDLHYIEQWYRAALQHAERKDAKQHGGADAVISQYSDIDKHASPHSVDRELQPPPPPTVADTESAATAEASATAAADQASTSATGTVSAVIDASEESAHDAMAQHLVHGPSFVDRYENQQRERRTSQANILAPPPASAYHTVNVANTRTPTSAPTTIATAPTVDSEINPFESDSESLSFVDDEDLASVALSGRQPELRSQDWTKIAAGKRFYHFACGSYGWMLYTMNHPWSVPTCRLCCTTDTPPTVSEMEGSGCACAGSGRRCCLLSVRAFALESGLSATSILYCHLTSAPVYYLAVDKLTRSLIVAVRGTLSLADCLIDLDASLSSLAPYGFPHGYTHTGILHNALRLRDHLDSKGVLDRFIALNPNYSLVIVGHSLGAGTAGLLTLILRARFAQRDGEVPNQAENEPTSDQTAQRPVATTALQEFRRPAPHEQGTTSANGINARRVYCPRTVECYIYGCPLLVDPLTAQSPFAMSSITTFIHRDDLIARLSLASMFQLKSKMIAAYEKSEARKWKIMAMAARNQWDAMEQYQLKKRWQTEAERRRRHSPSDSPQSMALKSIVIEQPRSHPLLPDRQQRQESYQRKSTPFSIVTVQPSQAEVLELDGLARGESSDPHASFRVHLRRLYLPGRVYLLVTKDSDSTSDTRTPCGSPTARRREPWFIFPAAHESFHELLISSRMLADHVPRLTAWENLDIPKQYAIS